MGDSKKTLFIRCSGAHCKNHLEVEEKDVTICADEQNTYFGIYGRCRENSCGFENLVREDHFESRDVKISCPGCDDKLSVTCFAWKKPEQYNLSFESRCDHCKKKVEVNWDI